jgi:hypothetical protein
MARACVLLVLMQFILSAFACPALPQRALVDAAAAPARVPPAAEWTTCDEHGDPRGLLKLKLRHERYVSDQAVDTRPLDVADVPVTSPVVTLLPQPVESQRVPVAATLLARATAPPIPIRFLVLRI